MKKIAHLFCPFFIVVSRNGTLVGCCFLPNAQNIFVVLLCHSSLHFAEKGILFLIVFKDMTFEYLSLQSGMNVLVSAWSSLELSSRPQKHG